MALIQAQLQYLITHQAGGSCQQQLHPDNPPSDMMPKTNTTTTVPIIIAVINAAKSLFMEVCGRSAFVFRAANGPLSHCSHYRVKSEGEYAVGELRALHPQL